MIRAITVSALAVAATTWVAGASAEDAPKRRIDQWSGIVFFCASDLTQKWTTDSCRAITEDVVAQAEAAGVKMAVLEPVSDPEQSMKKAADAGFDGGMALSMLYHFKGSDPPGGKTSLDFLIQAPVDPKPGVKPERWAMLGTQTTTIDPGEHPDAAEDAAARVWSGFLEYLTAPP
jgi:hypothetical protein